MNAVQKSSLKAQILKSALHNAFLTHKALQKYIMPLRPRRGAGPCMLPWIGQALLGGLGKVVACVQGASLLRRADFEIPVSPRYRYLRYLGDTGAVRPH